MADGKWTYCYVNRGDKVVAILYHTWGHPDCLMKLEAQKRLTTEGLIVHGGAPYATFEEAHQAAWELYHEAFSEGLD